MSAVGEKFMSKKLSKNISGFKKTGKILDSVFDIKRDSLISDGDINATVKMFNSIHDTIKSSDCVIIFDSYLVETLKNQKNRENREIISSLYMRCNDMDCRKIESEILNNAKYVIPKNHSEGFWKKYRNSDLVIASNTQENSNARLLNYSVFLFPVFLKPNKYTIGHFVLFAVYIDLRKIVMYDSLINSNNNNNVKINDENQGLKKIDRIISPFYDDHDQYRDIKEIFHVIENFVRALYVKKKMKVLFTKVNMDQKKREQKSNSNINGSGDNMDFGFFMDGYPLVQESLSCGLYTLYGIQDFMLNWPQRSTRKNGTFKMSDFCLMDTEQVKSLYYPVDQMLRRNKSLFITPHLSYKTYIAHIANMAIEGFISNHNRRYECPSIPRTVIVIGSSSTEGKCQTPSLYHSKDVSLYKEIIALFLKRRDAHNFRCIREFSHVRSIESTKHSPGAKYMDKQLHALFIEKCEDKDHEALIDALKFDQSKDVVIWILPFDSKQCNNKTQRIISSVLKSIISFIECLVIILPGSFVKVFYRAKQDSFKDVMNRIDIMIKDFSKINYLVDEDVTKLKIDNRPKNHKLLDVIISKNMKSDFCEGVQIELPPWDCTGLTWIQCSGGWFPYKIESKRKKK